MECTNPVRNMFVAVEAAEARQGDLYLRKRLTLLSAHLEEDSWHSEVVEVSYLGLIEVEGDSTQEGSGDGDAADHLKLMLISRIPRHWMISRLYMLLACHYLIIH